MKKIIITILFLLVSNYSFSGVVLDGTDDRLVSTVSLDGATAFTISVWVYKEDDGNFGGYDGIYGRGNASTRSPWIYGNSGTKYVILYFKTDFNSADCNRSTGDLEANAWSHIVGWWDGSDCKIYVNGVEEITFGTGGTTLASPGGNTFIGAIPGFQYWNGGIKDLSVWKNKALSVREIQDLYNSSLKTISCQIQPNDLLGYWSLDDYPDGKAIDGLQHRATCGSSSLEWGSEDGANNTGMTAKAEEHLSYQP